MKYDNPQLVATARKIGTSRFDLVGRLMAIKAFIEEANGDEIDFGEMASVVFADWSVGGRQVAEPEPDTKAKLTDAQKKEIQEVYGRGGMTQTELANKYQCSRPLIQKILKGIRKGSMPEVLSPEEAEKLNKFVNP